MELKPGISDRIYYEIYSQCNLSCIHCDDLLKNEKSVSLASDKLIEFHKIMTERFGCRQAIITGGEPSIHDDFYHIVESVAKLSDVSITTNGTTIDNDKILSVLSNYPNVVLQISVDGLTKETFEKVRGNNVYHVVFELINTLIDNGLEKQVGVSMTLLKCNIHEAMSMVEFCETNKLAFVHFPVLLPSGNALSHWNEIAPTLEEQLRIEEQLFMKISESETGLQISSNRLEQILSKIMPGYTDCKESFSLKVRPDGSIMPCPVAYKESHKLCKIDDEGFEQLLYEGLEKIRTRSIDSRSRGSATCSACDFMEYCRNSFCSNCEFLANDKREIDQYFCGITSYHLRSALEGCAED